MIYSEVCLITKAIRSSDVIDVIEHNLRLGFEKITIFDNESFEPIVYDHPAVSIHLIRGLANQIKRYAQYCKDNPNKSRWISFQDDDELMYIEDYTDVNEFLSKYEKHSGIGLCMKSISYSGDVPREKSDIHYIDECTHVDSDPREMSHVKSIVNPDLVRGWSQPHVPTFKRGIEVTYDGAKISSPHGNKWNDKAAFYHYKFKDYDNYYIKNERGRPNGGKRRLWSYDEYAKFIKRRHIVEDTRMREYWNKVNEVKSL